MVVFGGGKRVVDRRIVVLSFVDALASEVGVAVSRKRDLPSEKIYSNIQILFRLGGRMN